MDAPRPDRTALKNRVDAAKATLDAVLLTAPSLADVWRAWKLICQEIDADAAPEDQDWLARRLFEEFAVFAQSTLFVTGRLRVASLLANLPARGDAALDDDPDEKCA